MKKISLYALLFTFTLFLAACGQKKEDKPEKEKKQTEDVEEAADYTSSGTITMEEDTEGAGGADLFNLNTCEGTSVINASTTYENLVKIFGEENLSNEVRMYDEGTEENLVTLIYPDTKNELVIMWENEDEKKDPIMAETYIPESDWYTVGGIQIGTPLEKLIELNGNDFLFYGFGWDYGGSVSSWQGGKFDTEAPCFHVSLGYDYNKQAPNEVFGDMELSSDNPDLKGLDVQVAALRVFFK